jgi:hypothetical protein
VRGSLYFFALDAAIRQASGGARSLDDILLDLFARRAEGETVSVRTFTDALAKELGPGVAAELDSVVVRGTKTVFVPPDAFGPCFTHSWTQVVVPDFAFDRRTPEVQDCRRAWFRRRPRQTRDFATGMWSRHLSRPNCSSAIRFSR